MAASHRWQVPELSHGDKRTEAILGMVRNTLASIASSTLLRADVHFRDPGKFFDVEHAMGKATHTKFLEHPGFLRMFTAQYGHYFEEE